MQAPLNEARTMEALDAIRGNMAITHNAGAKVIVHSDDPSGSQRRSPAFGHERARRPLPGRHAQR